mmetsp:Transcript_51338/g.154251  ORF Transcript_51338/g.154251 Transcript_51338/m.154251 type:complete len:229 (+) Transcript_51338:312-998(+)
MYPGTLGEVMEWFTGKKETSPHSNPPLQWIQENHPEVILDLRDETRIPLTMFPNAPAAFLADVRTLSEEEDMDEEDRLMFPLIIVTSKSSSQRAGANPAAALAFKCSSLHFVPSCWLGCLSKELFLGDTFRFMVAPMSFFRLGSFPCRCKLWRRCCSRTQSAVTVGATDQDGGCFTNTDDIGIGSWSFRRRRRRGLDPDETSLYLFASEGRALGGTFRMNEIASSIKS